MGAWLSMYLMDRRKRLSMCEVIGYDQCCKTNSNPLLFQSLVEQLSPFLCLLQAQPHYLHLYMYSLKEFWSNMSTSAVWSNISYTGVIQEYK